MIRTTPRMTTLFHQLGLAADEDAIADFIRTHQLRSDAKIEETVFWTDAQREFLLEALHADAAWSITVDQLIEALHKDAVKASMDSK
jgi:hypothetical protein